MCSPALQYMCTKNASTEAVFKAGRDPGPFKAMDWEGSDVHDRFLPSSRIRVDTF